MISTLTYPYPTYTPNRIAAVCFTVIIGISLIAWIVQTYQTRFRPPRLSFLLLFSHLAICIELIVRVIKHDDPNSKTIFLVLTSLYAIGQRMIIIATYILVIDNHRKKSASSRVALVGAMLFVVTSGVLMAPANMLASDPTQLDRSFLFRKLSAILLVLVTILFYPVWYWSKTTKNMTTKAVILTIVSSLLSVVVSVFSLVQSLPKYYDELNSHEIWFYAFQIVPLISAHFAWSIFHPKRILRSLNGLPSEKTDIDPLLE